MSEREKSYWKTYRKIKSNVSGHIDFIYTDDGDIRGDSGRDIQYNSVVDDVQEAAYVMETETLRSVGNMFTAEGSDPANEYDQLLPPSVIDALENDDQFQSDGSQGDGSSLSDISEIDNDSILSDPIEENTDLLDSLADWASKFNITHSALRELLLILGNYHESLPKDPRTLLGTKVSYEVKDIAGGSYYHFGIANGVRLQLLDQPQERFQRGRETLLLQINIDGLPLFKSANAQFWPILGRIVSPFLGTPFVIGLFSGNSKPTDVHAYFQDFVAEMTELQQSHLEFPELACVFEVNISCVICDTPARAYVKQVKGHSGYGGCDKCDQHGVWIGKMTFPELNADLRTDVKFDEMSDLRHHLGPSPLRNINVGLVSQFPLDYMHLVCLGVVKRLLHIWLKGPLDKGRIAASSVKRISENILNLRKYLPREFLRKGRSLHEVDRWKATEYRQFLLYTGPVALHNIITRASYEHFLKLVIGIYCLSSPFFCQTHIAYANDLLRLFVVDIAKLYGEETLVYNVHGLVHLAKDVEKFGPLDNYSAFVFECFLGKLKRLVRKPNFPLQQVIRRFSENSSQISQQTTVVPSAGHVKIEHQDGPLPQEMHHCLQFKEIQLPTVFLSLKLGNNCILVGGKVALLRNIVCANAEEEKYIVYEEFGVMSNFFDSPLQSSDLMIYYVSELSGERKISKITDISLVFTDEDTTAIVPSNWLEGTKCAVWPSHIKGSGKMMKAVMDKLLPEDNWPAYPIRELYRHESFSDVRKRLKASEDKSDLNTDTLSDDDENQRRSKRKRKQPKTYSSDEEDRLSENNVPKPPSPIIHPKGSFGQKTPLWSAAAEGHRSSLQQVRHSLASNDEMGSSSFVRDIRSEYSATPIGSATPSRQVGRSLASNDEMGSSSFDRDIRSDCTSTPMRAAPPSEHIRRSVSCNDETSSSSLARDIRLFTVIEKLKSEQRDTKVLVQQLVVMVQALTTAGVAGPVDSTVCDDVVFPMSSDEDIADMEERLADRAFHNGLVTYLTVLGGRDIKDATRRVMGKTIGHSVAVRYNWSGQKDKLSFEKLKFSSVAQRAIVKTCGNNANMKEAEEGIKNWLRTASDREGGRKKRADKKKANAENQQ